jgi:hypothetical protein
VALIDTKSWIDVDGAKIHVANNSFTVTEDPLVLKLLENYKLGLIPIEDVIKLRNCMPVTFTIEKIEDEPINSRWEILDL